MVCIWKHNLLTVSYLMQINYNKLNTANRFCWRNKAKQKIFVVQKANLVWEFMFFKWFYYQQLWNIHWAIESKKRLPLLVVSLTVISFHVTIFEPILMIPFFPPCARCKIGKRFYNIVFTNVDDRKRPKAAAAAVKVTEHNYAWKCQFSWNWPVFKLFILAKVQTVWGHR